MNVEEKERLIKKDIKSIENRVRSAFNQGYDMGVKELKAYKEQSGDAISRQAAIGAFERFIHELGIEDEPYNYGEMALSVKNVQSVTPQQVLDKIRAEIEHIGGDDEKVFCKNLNESYKQGLKDALKVIDKYKAETVHFMQVEEVEE